MNTFLCEGSTPNDSPATLQKEVFRQKNCNETQNYTEERTNQVHEVQASEAMHLPHTKSRSRTKRSGSDVNGLSVVEMPKRNTPSSKANEGATGSEQGSQTVLFELLPPVVSRAFVGVIEPRLNTEGNLFYCGRCLTHGGLSPVECCDLSSLEFKCGNCYEDNSQSDTAIIYPSEVIIKTKEICNMAELCPMHEDRTRSAVVVYCLVCQTAMCKSCFKKHRKFKDKNSIQPMTIR